jgi:hypothetical protein
MLGKIKEYVIKNLFFKKNIPIETGPSQDDAASEDQKNLRQQGTSKPGILWKVTEDQLIKAENRQQNDP